MILIYFKTIDLTMNYNASPNDQFKQNTKLKLIITFNQVTNNCITIYISKIYTDVMMIYLPLDPAEI